VFLGAEFTWGQIIAVLLIASGLQLRLFALVWC
jgi:hypothetical protein